MTATLTLAGMLNYRPDLLDNLQLPHAPTSADYYDMGLETSQVRQAWSIDADQFAAFLCFHTMGMSLAVPDADYLKQAIGIWSASHVHEWQRMFDTLFYRYNPIWNKDAKTTESDHDERETHNSGTNSGTQSGTNNVTGYTNGYDGGSSTEASPPLPATGGSIAWTHSDKTMGTTGATISSTGSQSGTDEYDHSRTVIEQGNIGVTQVQQMITAEREAAKYNIEEIIANAFKAAFCIQVY